jgi:hypothetical protein
MDFRVVMLSAIYNLPVRARCRVLFAFLAFLGTARAAWN